MRDLQISPFFGDFTGDGREDAPVVAYPADRDDGNSHAIDMMLFAGGPDGFRFLRKVEGGSGSP